MSPWLFPSENPVKCYCSIQSISSISGSMPRVRFRWPGKVRLRIAEQSTEVISWLAGNISSGCCGSFGCTTDSDLQLHGQCLL
ncbi:hypothetical protein CEXT_465931 [Caerostris extrusa]|uniref:Uncharacterized protein n=1 Tax=Caerostris extrusa TaxID=172846 RepID=A0AAV4XVJ5_CAEEX|nr:hypothetical protein CEXT_465931 [Caerostris extrusa]